MRPHKLVEPRYCGGMMQVFEHNIVCSSNKSKLGSTWFCRQPKERFARNGHYGQSNSESDVPGEARGDSPGCLVWANANRPGLVRISCFLPRRVRARPRSQPQTWQTSACFCSWYLPQNWNRRLSSTKLE